MTRINTYKLKNGVSKEDLSKLGFREGSWHSLYEGRDINASKNLLKLAI